MKPTPSSSIAFYASDFELPLGYTATGIASGIKKDQALDMGLLFSKQPAQSAGLFTSSKFTGHCIDICREKLQIQNQSFHGVLVNSGNSNTATGPQGRANSEKLIQRIQTYLNQKKNMDIHGDFFISHTGVIGVPLPMQTMLENIPALGDKIFALCEQQNNENIAGQQETFARAIMTTDTYPKGARVQVRTEQGMYTISGIAKGAGMIGPNMATMLCYITTDAAITNHPSPNVWQQILKNATDQSFNCITVDGDMSPDDSIIIFANGASGIGLQKESEWNQFQKALNQLTLYLAKNLVRDAEGATKLVSIHIQNAASYKEAKQAGLAIANSPLVKTAFFGEDANWGRILTALGYSGANFELAQIQLFFGPYLLFDKGQGITFSEQNLKTYLQNQEIEILLQLNQGKSDISIYTSDLSIDYIHINADYRS